ncbi:MAG: hypothetical protein SGCHY_000452 [Lobulomycetales sp.]
MEHADDPVKEAALPSLPFTEELFKDIRNFSFVFNTYFPEEWETASGEEAPRPIRKFTQKSPHVDRFRRGSVNIRYFNLPAITSVDTHFDSVGGDEETPSEMVISENVECDSVEALYGAAGIVYTAGEVHATEKELRPFGPAMKRQQRLWEGFSRETIIPRSLSEKSPQHTSMSTRRVFLPSQVDAADFDKQLLFPRTKFFPETRVDFSAKESDNSCNMEEAFGKGFAYVHHSTGDPEPVTRPNTGYKTLSGVQTNLISEFEEITPDTIACNPESKFKPSLPIRIRSSRSAATARTTESSEESLDKIQFIISREPTDPFNLRRRSDPVNGRRRSANVMREEKTSSVDETATQINAAVVHELPISRQNNILVVSEPRTVKPCLRSNKRASPVAKPDVNPLNFQITHAKLSLDPTNSRPLVHREKMEVRRLTSLADTSFVRGTPGVPRNRHPESTPEYCVATMTISSQKEFGIVTDKTREVVPQRVPFSRHKTTANISSTLLPNVPTPLPESTKIEEAINGLAAESLLLSSKSPSARTSIARKSSRASSRASSSRRSSLSAPPAPLLKKSTRTVMSAAQKKKALKLKQQVEKEFYEKLLRLRTAQAHIILAQIITIQRFVRRVRLTRRFAMFRDGIRLIQRRIRLYNCRKKYLEILHQREKRKSTIRVKREFLDRAEQAVIPGNGKYFQVFSKDDGATNFVAARFSRNISVMMGIFSVESFDEGGQWDALDEASAQFDMSLNIVLSDIYADYDAMTDIQLPEHWSGKEDLAVLLSEMKGFPQRRSLEEFVRTENIILRKS